MPYGWDNWNVMSQDLGNTITVLFLVIRVVFRGGRRRVLLSGIVFSGCSGCSDLASWMDLSSSLLSLYGGLCYVFYACSTLISSLGVDVSGSRPYQVAYYSFVTPLMLVEDSFPLPGFLPENGFWLPTFHLPEDFVALLPPPGSLFFHPNNVFF